MSKSCYLQPRLPVGERNGHQSGPAATSIHLHPLKAKLAWPLSPRCAHAIYINNLHWYYTTYFPGNNCNAFI
jgi:hypothetical protein